MGSVRNISADARYVPLIDRQLEPDEIIDVPDHLLDAEHYAWDPDVWQVDVAADDARTLPELKAEAEKRGLPVSGTKKELADRIAAHDTEPGE